MRLTSILILGLAQFCFAKPLKRWDNFATKHAWEDIPRGWVLYGDAPADHMLDMRIGLRQDKLDQLISALYEVSDPSHQKYGAHLSKEEVEALVAPHPTTLSLVQSWLTSHNIDPSTAVHYSGASSWLSFRISVTQAERMLNTKYNVYFNPSTSSYIVRTTEYSLPYELHSHVDVVSPTTYFGSLKQMRATSFLMPKIISSPHELANPVLSSSGCVNTVTPACLRTQYNSSTYVPSATSKNQLGIVGYLDQFANNADLQTFFGKFRPDAAGATFTTVLVNGGLNDQSKPGVEANLDIQYAEGISYPTPNIYYSNGGSPPFNPDIATPSNTNEPYLDWLNFILNQTTIPQTFSTSYGDDEQTVPSDYAASVCSMFAQLGARGSSIMFSSGDSGVGTGTCLTNDGTNKVVFQPIFPASCPHVTSVGGTVESNPEVAVSFSGGGFSNYFPQPSYQSSAVSAYLTSLATKHSGLFNKTGRAYPDVAAQAKNFQVVVGGSVESVAGTSCSSPTFAAIIALLNDFRISNGKPPLGFLNPFLYSTGVGGLLDIESGSNPGCGTSGFTARVGWDPVTGLGTPNFGLLKALV